MVSLPKWASIVLIAVVGLSGCATPNASGINDPYEQNNRAWHDVNTGLDQALIGPASKTYGGVPEPVRKGFTNVSDTLSLPGIVVNDVLQFQLLDALHNTTRFALNATLGIGGLFDPATAAGLEERDSDFGETLHVWGVGEGRYMVLPVYGPSTERDALGIAVDWVIDPLGSLLTPRQNQIKTALTVADLANSRVRYSDIYEGILYESADAYTQMRLTYLDNRRFELGRNGATASQAESTETYDIYEDFYE